MSSSIILIFFKFCVDRKRLECVQVDRMMSKFLSPRKGTFSKVGLYYFYTIFSKESVFPSVILITSEANELRPSARKKLAKCCSC